MSTVTQIKTCRTPLEALLLLAREIDVLREDLVGRQRQHAPLDWGDALVELIDDLPSSDSLRVPDHAEQAQQAIAAVRAEIDACRDGEDLRALEAKLKLLRDAAGEKVYESESGGGGTIDGVPDGSRPVIQSADMQGDVHIPLVSPERRLARIEWAASRVLDGFLENFTPGQAQRAYAKGGPMWLYLGNREAVMAMPYNYRQELVEEIARDSEADAQEVGRDILKSIDSTDREITATAIDSLSASRGLR